MASGGKAEEEAAALHVKQGSKVFSKLLSRESSAAAPSFRVYYGVASAGSVPFLWESQPGTPKNDAMSAAALPPLTPPPSYYTAKVDTSHKGGGIGVGGGGRKYLRLGILGSILPKIMLRKAARPPSSPPASSSCSSSSSSSTSLSSSSSSSLSFRSTQSPKSCSASMRSHAHAGAFSVGDDDDDDDEEMMTACFRVRHESFRALKGCRVAMTVRSALAASAAGHGAAPATVAQRV